MREGRRYLGPPTTAAMSPHEPHILLPLLTALDVFRPLPAERLQRLAEAVVTLVFAAGAIIVREGDSGDYFYIVVEGGVDLMSDGEVVARRGPNEHFGEAAVLRGVPHRHSAVARVPSTLYAIERKEFVAATRADVTP